MKAHAVLARVLLLARFRLRRRNPHRCSGKAKLDSKFKMSPSLAQLTTRGSWEDKGTTFQGAPWFGARRWLPWRRCRRPTLCVGDFRFEITRGVFLPGGGTLLLDVGIDEDTAHGLLLFCGETYSAVRFGASKSRFSVIRIPSRRKAVM